MDINNKHIDMPSASQERVLDFVVQDIQDELNMLERALWDFNRGIDTEYALTMHPQCYLHQDQIDPSLLF